MDKVKKLIHLFREENTNELENVDSSLKTNIIAELEDIDLRWNALTAIEESGQKEQTVKILKKLVHHPDFKKSVLRKLNEYNQ